MRQKNIYSNNSKRINTMFTMLKKSYILPIIIGILIGIATFMGGARVYNITSTNESCEACHVHPHATDSWKLSVHHNSKSGVPTDCVDCHLPPKGNFKHFIAKSKMGVKDMFAYMLQDSTDFNWEAKKELGYAQKIVYNESCEKCHTNLFPSRINDEGIAAHLYYMENAKNMDLQCISCHIDVGHYDPEYAAKKKRGFLIDSEEVEGEVFSEATKVTTFDNFTEQIPGTSETVNMKAIPGGEFMMGSPDNEPFRKDDEGPQRLVRLSPFFMSEYEVTWSQFWTFYKETMAINREPYEWVMENNSHPDVDAISGPTAPYGAPDQGWGAGDRPAITMSHYAAEIFCVWLSKKTGKRYRLPTEAEWEYAVRGGTSTPYFFEGNPKKFSDKGFIRQIFGVDTTTINSYVIYNQNSHNKSAEPSAVGANPYGLKNMLGNVMEYCADKYDPEAYSKMPEESNDPQPNMEGEEYVVRGGAYFDDASQLRSASRGSTSHEEWIKTDPQMPKSIWWYTDIKAIGFRVVCEYDELKNQL